MVVANEKGSEPLYPGQARKARRVHPDVFLFSHSRTASNLLCRLLSDQPGWVQSEYHYQDAFIWARKSFNWGPVVELSHQQRQQLEKLIQQGHDSLDRARTTAIFNDESLLTKNHTFQIWDPALLSQSIWGGPTAPLFEAFPANSKDSTVAKSKSNPTFYTDDYLMSWLPIFLIRHPALVFESWYKTESYAGPVDIFDKSWAYYTTFKFSRALFDWYVSKTTAVSSHRVRQGTDQTLSAIAPIVVDADDIVERTAVIDRICDLCGMDPARIRYEWEKTVPDDATLNTRHHSYMASIWDSTTIDRSKSSRGLSMESKCQQWESQYGNQVAAELSRLVEEAMPDYLHLRSKKL